MPTRVGSWQRNDTPQPCRSRRRARAPRQSTTALFERPEQWHGGSGGAGVGYGIGAALGVGLAYRGTDTIVVNVQPEFAQQGSGLDQARERK